MATPSTHVHDLAISAVAYDTILVKELIALLATRLHRSPVWRGTQPVADDLPPALPVSATLLHEDESRVAVVLAQRLWGNDALTAPEAAILRERARRAPKSVVVVALDDEPLAPWMSRLRRHQLATLGVEGVAEAVLHAVADAGGSVEPGSFSGPADRLRAPVRWPEPPTPFLGQPRAHSALRRELDSLCAAIEPRFEGVGAHEGEHIAELHVLPNRVVARFDAVGVSFSWVPGRVGTVADGRLMVIEWTGVAADRGPGALRTARPMRERVYTAEAKGADEWCWRADGPNGRASSTANLVGEWMDGASMPAAV